MATTKQRTAAKRNVRKAQAVWQSMSHREHARAQPALRPPTTKAGRVPPGLISL
jgi:hypothetical protein